MPLSLFHPREGKGSSITFSFNSKEQNLFVTLTKEASWDAPTDGGSCCIKLSIVELGAFLRVLRERSAFIANHNNNGIETEIQFAPDIKGAADAFRAARFKYKCTQQGSVFGIYLNLDEAQLLEEYFRFVLEHFFSAIYSSDKKEAEDRKKEIVETESKPKTDRKKPEIKKDKKAPAVGRPEDDGDVSLDDLGNNPVIVQKDGEIF